MSERDRKRYRKIKSDPVKYAEYLERKRREMKTRPDYERERKRKWRANNPGKTKLIRDAGHAVELAVKNGKLVKRLACSNCLQVAKVEAHHHKGYEPKHWLDVVWLCPGCHRKADAAGIAPLKATES